MNEKDIEQIIKHRKGSKTLGDIMTSSPIDAYFELYQQVQQQIEAYKLSENEAKEIIAEYKQENKKLKRILGKIEKYAKSCNLKADYTALDVLEIIEEMKK